MKVKPRGYNSFLISKNNHIYQIDFFFMGYYDFDEEEKFRGGLVCIDILIKYTVVVPIKTKNNENFLEIIKEILRKMGKNTKIIYTDNKYAIAGKDFKDYMGR